MPKMLVALRLALLLSLVLCAQSVDLRTTFKIGGSMLPSFLENGGDDDDSGDDSDDDDSIGSIGIPPVEERDDVRPQLIVSRFPSFDIHF